MPVVKRMVGRDVAVSSKIGSTITGSRVVIESQKSEHFKDREG